MVLEGIEDEVCSNDFSDFTFDELLETFHKLMYDSTLLARKLNDIKVMHKNLNDKLTVAHTNAEILQSGNTIITSKLHELSNSNHDHDKPDNDKLIGILAGSVFLRLLSTKTRTEYDTFGPLEVPSDRSAFFVTLNPHKDSA